MDYTIKPFDNTGYQKAQKYHEQAGTQITPGEYTSFGGSLGNYAKNYGEGSWYNPDGSTTGKAPSYVRPAVQQDPNMAKNMELMFPKFRPANDYVPNPTDDPTFQWQDAQRKKSLDRLMSARGLLGSGAEIAAETESSNALIANTANDRRQFGLQQQAMGSAFDNELANRVFNQTTDSANRDERYKNEMWNRLFDTTSLQVSQNPMNYAYQALGNYSNLLGQTPVGGRGRGGSRGGTSTPVLPQLPGSPNYGGVDALANLIKPSQNVNYGQIFSNLASNLFT